MDPEEDGLPHQPAQDDDSFALPPSADAPAPDLEPPRKRLRPQGSELFSLVCKIFVDRAKPNYYQPWQVQTQTSSTGSGICLGDRLILTNAHVVECSLTIRVQRHGFSRKYAAVCVCIGQQCDLALLRVPDDEFWQNFQPIDFGPLPDLQESVTVVGYPTGGSNLSVTRGVVSRLDLRQYRSLPLLVVQIDAAINPGNSGGPAFSRNKQLTGVAFSRHVRGENIGYVIPTTVIQFFLEEYKNHGKFRGICDIGVRVQEMENSCLRQQYRMGTRSGVLITAVEPLCPFSEVLAQNDVLLELDGEDVADDGTVSFRESERIFFTYLVRSKPVGTTMTLCRLRNGVETTEKVDIDIVKPLVAHLHGFDAQPSYYIVCGFVLQPLSFPLLYSMFGSQWQKKASCAIVERTMYGTRDVPNREVVVISQMLSHESNLGYRHSYFPSLVTEINGVKPQNLDHAAKIVEKALGRLSRSDVETPTDELPDAEEFITFTLYPVRVITMRCSDILQSERAVLEQHGVARAMSLDIAGNLEELTLPPSEGSRALRG